MGETGTSEQKGVLSMKFDEDANSLIIMYRKKAKEIVDALFVEREILYKLY